MKRFHVKWETFLTVGESPTHGTDEPAIPRAAHCEPVNIAATKPRCCA